MKTTVYVWWNLEWYSLDSCPAFVKNSFRCKECSHRNIFHFLAFFSTKRDHYRGLSCVLNLFSGTVSHQVYPYLKFSLVYVSGNIVPTATIYQNLKYIANDPTPAPNFPVAALTSENRDTWASMRHLLEAIPGNEEVLKLIDSAIFVLCLDDHEVNSVADVTRTFLHGDGKNRSAIH